MDASDSAQVTRPFVAAIAAPHPATGSVHSLPLGPVLSKHLPPDRLTAFPSAPTLPKALPPTRLASFSLLHVMTKAPLRQRLTALPPATASSKTKIPPRHPLAAFQLASALYKTKTPPRHRLTAFPQATALAKTKTPPRYHVRESRRGHWRSSQFGLQATRRLPIVHLGRLGFELSSCLVRPDIFSDPEPLRRCSWKSPYSCELLIWLSTPGYHRFKTISPAPPTYS